jgi:hypothetical protein
VGAGTYSNVQTSASRDMDLAKGAYDGSEPRLLHACLVEPFALEANCCEFAVLRSVGSRALPAGSQ